MDFRCWKVNLQVASLADIVEWCLKKHRVNRLLVSLRMERQKRRWQPIDTRIEHFVKDRFGPYIVDSFLASAWPGTELIGHPGQIFVLRFAKSVQMIVLETQPILRGWYHNSVPPLPEDLCLYRTGDQHPVFVSVTHERMAWLLSSDEPAVSGVSLDENQSLDLLHFGAQQEFCRRWTEPKRKA